MTERERVEAAMVHGKIEDTLRLLRIQFTIEGAPAFYGAIKAAVQAGVEMGLERDQILSAVCAAWDDA